MSGLEQYLLADHRRMKAMAEERAALAPAIVGYLTGTKTWIEFRDEADATMKAMVSGPEQGEGTQNAR